MELLTGEPLALDLLNTRAKTTDGEVDALDSRELFDRWLAAERPRMTSAYEGMGDSSRARVRAFREHVRAAVEVARRSAAPDDAAIEAINDAARAAPVCTILVPSETGVVAVKHRGGGELDRLLAELAESAVELIASPDVRKVRECEGPQCRMLFLPAHPRRRWCSPALCGNRARVARYYQRHKGSAIRS
jgi:predicted RNA-binding Zn ribbon-like protein